MFVPRVNLLPKCTEVEDAGKTMWWRRTAFRGPLTQDVVAGQALLKLPFPRMYCQANCYCVLQAHCRKTACPAKNYSQSFSLNDAHFGITFVQSGGHLIRSQHQLFWCVLFEQTSCLLYRSLSWQYCVQCWAMSHFFLFLMRKLWVVTGIENRCHLESLCLLGKAVLKDQRIDKRLLECPFKDIWM